MREIITERLLKYNILVCVGKVLLLLAEEASVSSSTALLLLFLPCGGILAAFPLDTLGLLVDDLPDVLFGHVDLPNFPEEVVRTRVLDLFAGELGFFASFFPQLRWRLFHAPQDEVYTRSNFFELDPRYFRTRTFHPDCVLSEFHVFL